MAIIRLVSAEPLDPEKVQEILKPLTSEDGENRVVIEEDPSILGGYILYFDNRRIDMSLRHKLERIDQQLKAGISSDKLEPKRMEVEEIGRVTKCSDGIVFCSGLDHVMSNERLVFDNGEQGLALNLAEEHVGVLLIGDVSKIKTGDVCKRTYEVLEVPVGDALLGRVVDSLGRAIDGDEALPKDMPKRPIEEPAPGILARQPVKEAIYTGITAIDAMIPIGKGQRELIIGDRQTGKTSIASDMILNQKGKNVYCIYVAIGQKMSTIYSLVDSLREAGAMEYTTVVSASASCSTAEVYMAPYTACAMAEEWMHKGKDVLVVYDDLTKHAQAYRALSLLLRRPPGREAYPGDVFYIHSRLLERASKLSDDEGGGSMTAIPIIETQGGDISAYIPTNVISITDGQIYLESDLFFAGQRPAINVGLSVSRVGGDAQASVMRKSAGPLRVQLAQFRELQAFAQFGSDLDPSTRKSLELGARLNEVLKQGKGEPRSMAESVLMLQLAVHNDLTGLEVHEITEFMVDYLVYLRSREHDLLAEIESVPKVEDELYDKIKKSYNHYLTMWKQDK